MSGWGAFACAAAACLLGGSAAGLVVGLKDARRRKRARRMAALGSIQAGEGTERRPGGWTMGYCESLSTRLFVGTTEPIAPSVRRKQAAGTRVGRRYGELAASAVCAKTVSASAFCEARARLAIAGALAGGLLGSFLSVPLAVVLATGGAVLGASSPMRAVKAERRSRGLSAERHLSEMLEVVSLGLRSGLTFDRAFALYGSHFDNEFARSCARAYRCWSLGLVTREEALRDLAASYDCDQLGRVVDSVVRSLRFGSSLTGFLADAAEQSRATYRAALEERVAKAPVKMMLPTGTLILPAMLLLVMGPVLLEVVGGF